MSIRWHDVAMIGYGSTDRETCLASSIAGDPYWWGYPDTLFSYLSDYLSLSEKRTPFWTPHLWSRPPVVRNENQDIYDLPSFIYKRFEFGQVAISDSNCAAIEGAGCGLDKPGYAIIWGRGADSTPTLNQVSAYGRGSTVPSQSYPKFNLRYDPDDPYAYNWILGSVYYNYAWHEHYNPTSSYLYMYVPSANNDGKSGSWSLGRARSVACAKDAVAAVVSYDGSWVCTTKGSTSPYAQILGSRDNCLCLKTPGGSRITDAYKVVGNRYGFALLTESGDIYVWGYSYAVGQLNTDADNRGISIKKLELDVPCRDVSLGQQGGLAVGKNGKAYAWGANKRSVWGSGVVQVPGISGAMYCSAGYDHSVITCCNGSVWGWGASVAFGQSTRITTPTRLTNLPPIRKAVAGVNTTKLLTMSGLLLTLGSVEGGRDGSRPCPAVYDNDPDSASYKTYVKTHADARPVWDHPRIVGVTSSSSARHAAATNMHGNVSTFGAYSSHQHGDGTKGTPVSVRTPIMGTWKLPNLQAIAVACGDRHTLYVDIYNRVWACGDQEFGQCGAAEANSETGLVESAQLAGIDGVVAVAAGGNGSYPGDESATKGFSLALKKDGTVWGCGVGPGCSGDSTWEQVSGLSNIVAIAAGPTHCMALDEDGVPYTWGSQLYGELGRSIGGNYTDTPGAVADLIADQIACGAQFSMARRKSDRRPVAWGAGGYGQLGNMDSADSTTPVEWGTQAVEKIAAGVNHSVALKTPCKKMFGKFVTDGDTDVEEMEEPDEWVNGTQDEPVEYEKGQLVTYNNIIYRCISTHETPFPWAIDYWVTFVPGVRYVINGTEVPKYWTRDYAPTPYPKLHIELDITGDDSFENLVGIEPWENGTSGDPITYEVGQLVAYAGAIYKCINEHETPSLVGGSWYDWKPGWTYLIDEAHVTQWKQVFIPVDLVQDWRGEVRTSYGMGIISYDPETKTVQLAREDQGSPEFGKGVIWEGEVCLVYGARVAGSGADEYIPYGSCMNGIGTYHDDTDMRNTEVPITMPDMPVSVVDIACGANITYAATYGGDVFVCGQSYVGSGGGTDAAGPGDGRHSAGLDVPTLISV